MHMSSLSRADSAGLLPDRRAQRLHQRQGRPPECQAVIGTPTINKHTHKRAQMVRESHSTDDWSG